MPNLNANIKNDKEAPILLRSVGFLLGFVSLLQIFFSILTIFKKIEYCLNEIYDISI